MYNVHGTYIDTFKVTQYYEFSTIIIILLLIHIIYYITMSYLLISYFMPPKSGLFFLRLYEFMIFALYSL